MKRINCMACKYFFVTWDPQYPKGCRAFNFKTSNIPSVDVYQSSGEVCLKFEQKETYKGRRLK